MDIKKKCVLFYKISGLISPRLTLGKTRSPADSAVLEAGQPEAVRAREEVPEVF